MRHSHRCVLVYITKCHLERTTWPSWIDLANVSNSIKSVCTLIFIVNVLDLVFKVNYSHGVYWEVRTWKFCKPWQMEKDYCQQIDSYVWTFIWHIYIRSWRILKVKVMVMHTSNVNIPQTVIDKSNITIAIKCKVSYGLSISIFRFVSDLLWRSTWPRERCTYDESLRKLNI